MLTEILGRLFDAAGAEWVLWLLIAMSVVSVAIIVQRLMFFRANAVDASALAVTLSEKLRAGGGSGVETTLKEVVGMPGMVLRAAHGASDLGPEAVEEVVGATIAVERVRYDRFLAILGTVAANAPFVGLLGTVIGVLNAFGQLAGALEGQSRAELVMGSISEALVATAAGLAVAIPAVIAYNYFKRRTAVAVAETRSLSGLLLAHLRGGEG